MAPRVSPIREAAGCVDSGLASLCLKSIPLGGGLLPRMWEMPRQGDQVVQNNAGLTYARGADVKASGLRRLETRLIQ